MSRQVIFTTALVERTGQLGDVMASFLEEQVSEIQKRLQTKYPKTADNTVWKIISTFSTLEGTKIPLTLNEVEERVDFPSPVLAFTLDNLEKARILRLADNIYEVAHDTLALQISDKRSGEEKLLLEVEKLVDDRYNAYLQTNTLLSRKEIDYISPYQSRLTLDKDRKHFIEKSQRIDKRKRRLLVIAIIGAFAILTLFSLYSYQQKLEANAQRQKAIEQTDIAKKERKKAVALKDLANDERTKAVEQTLIAQGERQKALAQKKIADENAVKAKLQQDIAEEQRNKAKESEEEAKKQQGIAEKQTNKAKKSEEEAKAQTKRANAQTEIANAETKRANDQKVKTQKLQRSTLAIALASKSSQLKYNTRMKVLLAKEAYSLQRSTKDAIVRPEIYTALFNAVKEIRGDGFDEIRGYHQGAVRSIQLSNSGKNLYTTGSDGKLIKWNLNPENIIGKPTTTHKFITNSDDVEMIISLSSDGKWLVLAGKKQKVELMNLETHNSEFISINEQHSIYDIQFLPNSSGFLALSSNRNIQKYDINSRKTETIHSFVQSAEKIAVHPEGKYVAIGGKQGLLKLINLENKSVAKVYNAGRAITALRFDPSTKHLFLGLSDGEILQMKYQEGSYSNTVKKRKAHGRQITDFDFFQEGNDLDYNFFAASSNDGTVTMWKLKMFEDERYEPFVLEDNQNWAMSVKFINDGQQLAVGYRDGSIKFWTLSIRQLGKDLCGLINENDFPPLNNSEYEQYVDRKGLKQKEYQDYCK
jgi:hypothetical protein